MEIAISDGAEIAREIAEITAGRITKACIIGISSQYVHAGNWSQEHAESVDIKGKIVLPFIKEKLTNIF